MAAGQNRSFVDQDAPSRVGTEERVGHPALPADEAEQDNDPEATEPGLARARIRIQHFGGTFHRGGIVTYSGQSAQARLLRQVPGYPPSAVLDTFPPPVRMAQEPAP